MRFFYFLFIAFISLTSLTQAADSLHLCCVGLVSIKNGTDKSVERLAFLYDDVRSGVDKRKITVSMSHNGNNYRGEEISSGGVTKIKLINVDDATDILFEGTVEFIGGERNGLEFVGKYSPEKDNSLQIKVAFEGFEVPVFPVK